MPSPPARSCVKLNLQVPTPKGSGFFALRISKLEFVELTPFTPFSCFGKKRAKRSRHRGGAVRWPAPAPEPPAPMYPTRPALTKALEHLNLNPEQSKNVPIFALQYGAVQNRQGGESGAAAVSKTATMCCHVVRASRGYSVRAGGVHRGGRNLSRGSAA